MVDEVKVEGRSDLDEVKNIFKDAVGKLDTLLADNKSFKDRLDAIEAKGADEELRRKDEEAKRDAEAKEEVKPGEELEIKHPDLEVKKDAGVEGETNGEGSVDPVMAADPELVDTGAEPLAADSVEDMPMVDAASRHEIVGLKAELARLRSRVPAMLSDNDRQAFAVYQEHADKVYSAFGERAPAPLEGETPTIYRRRLASKLQAHSAKWKNTKLSSIGDPATLGVIVDEIFVDAKAYADSGASVAAGDIFFQKTISPTGHTIITPRGSSSAWMNIVSGNTRKATGSFRSVR